MVVFAGTIAVLLFIVKRNIIMKFFEKYIHTIWFIFVFSTTMYYCCKNWAVIVAAKPYECNFILFCFLLILALLPYISNFKIFNFEGKINNPLCPTKKLAEENLTKIEDKTPIQNNVNLNIQVNQEEYKKQIAKILQEKGVKNE